MPLFATLVGAFWLVWFALYMSFDKVGRSGWNALEGSDIGTIVYGMFIAGIGLVGVGPYIFNSFFGVTDATIRFDQKRQKVWMWTGKVPIEMEWANLVPPRRNKPCYAVHDG